MLPLNQTVLNYSIVMVKLNFSGLGFGSHCTVKRHLVCIAANYLTKTFDINLNSEKLRHSVECVLIKITF